MIISHDVLDLTLRGPPDLFHVYFNVQNPPLTCSNMFNMNIVVQRTNSPVPGPTIHGSPGSASPLGWQVGGSHTTDRLSCISCTSISLLETSTKLYFELFDYTKDHFTGQKLHAHAQFVSLQNVLKDL